MPELKCIVCGNNTSDYRILCTQCIAAGKNEEIIRLYNRMIEERTYFHPDAFFMILAWPKKGIDGEFITNPKFFLNGKDTLIASPLEITCTEKEIKMQVKN